MAIALSEARKRSKGGLAGKGSAMVPEKHFPDGLIASTVPGRTDRHPLSVPAGAHVIPADVVSGLGQGNTMAGAKMWQEMTQHIIGQHKSTGGAVKNKPDNRENASIIAAGGEYIVPPEGVMAWGHGDPKKGHDAIDKVILDIRKRTTKSLKGLAPPKR